MKFRGDTHQRNFEKAALTNAPSRSSPSLSTCAGVRALARAGWGGCSRMQAEAGCCGVGGYCQQQRKGRGWKIQSESGSGRRKGFSSFVLLGPRCRRDLVPGDDQVLIRKGRNGETGAFNGGPVMERDVVEGEERSEACRDEASSIAISILLLPQQMQSRWRGDVRDMCVWLCRGCAGAQQAETPDGPRYRTAEAATQGESFQLFSLSFLPSHANNADPRPRQLFCASV